MFKKIKTFLLIIFILVLAFLSYMLFWPVGDDITTWNMEPKPLAQGVLAPNDVLSKAEKFGPKLPWGNEDIVIGPDGYLYSSTQEGKIMKISPDGRDVELYADIGGQLLGITFDQEGNLYIANSTVGLQVVDPKGVVETLVTEVNGKPIGFAAEVTVAKDGRVYFTDGSHQYKDIFMIVSKEPSGRVISYDPATQEATELMTGLRFANGISLSHDETFLLVNEMGYARIWRHWLQGEKAGTSDIFLKRAPGTPDNISRGENGLYWVALFDDSQGMFQLSQSKALSKIMARIPVWATILLTPKNSGVIALDGQGNIVKYFFDGKGVVPNVSSAVERDGWLYLGNITSDYIYRLEVNSNE